MRSALAVIITLACALQGPQETPKPVHKAQPVEAKAAVDQRGTRTTPVIVQHSAADRAWDAQQRAEDQGDKPPDWWMFGITVVLAAIAFVQAVLFVRQLGLMKDAMGDTKLATEAAKTGAEAAKVSADAARVSADTTLKQFIAAQRPRLAVRHIALRVEGYTDTVSFNVANVGSSVARVIQSNVTAYGKAPDDPLPAIPPYSGARNSVAEIILEPGQQQEVTHPSPTDNNVLLFATLENAPANWEGYVIGYILYQDEIGTNRRLAFCRRYNPATGRFTAVDDPDYEYAD